MRSTPAGFVLFLAAAAAVAQVPPAAGNAGSAAIEQKQRQAGVVYRQLQQAQHDAKLAEQDVLNAEQAHGLAQKQADERKSQLETARKALAAAQDRSARARKAYDETVSGVDQAFQKTRRRGPKARSDGVMW